MCLAWASPHSKSRIPPWIGEGDQGKRCGGKLPTVDLEKMCFGDKIERRVTMKYGRTWTENNYVSSVDSYLSINTWTVISTHVSICIRASNDVMFGVRKGGTLARGPMYLNYVLPLTESDQRRAM